MVHDTKKYKVSLLDEAYSLVSDEPEHVVIKGAEMVNDLVATIKSQSPFLTDKQICALALLQLASDSYKMAHQMKSYKEKEEELFVILDQAL